MPTIKLTKRTVDAQGSQASRFTVWDTEISGFGLRVTPNGERTYVLKYRLAGQQRWFTIGRHGSPWTPEMARLEARRLLGEVAKGLDPAEKKSVDRNALTLAGLCDLYLREGVAHKKPSTLKVDRGRIRHHLSPLLGHKRVDAITRADVERLLMDVSRGKTAAPEARGGRRKAGSVATGGDGVAARCVSLLATILEFGVKRKMRPDNPARGIKTPKSKKMERFLSDAEVARLAESLDQEACSGRSPYPATAVRLLLLTGCRRSEILGLRWEHVDFEHRCLRLPDSKTGAKIVYLNAPALRLLSELPRISGNSHVIPGTQHAAAFVGIDKVWFRVRKKAGLGNVRLHDLRHSFASFGASGGLSLLLIGALLGHRNSTTTQRYAHLSADRIRAANETVGARIAAAMDRRASIYPAAGSK